MQLAGQDGDKRVWGPPRDIPGAIAVLREAVDSGVNHIDTSDFYGPHVTNQIIKQALHPYPGDLVIVTKVGGAPRRRWFLAAGALTPVEIVDAVHDNLRNLGLDALQVVNLRLGGFAAPEDEPFGGTATRTRRVEAAKAWFSISRPAEQSLPSSSPRRRRLRRLSAFRTSTTSRGAATIHSSTIWPPRALPMCHSFRSAGFHRSSRQRSTRLRRPCRRRQCRSRWRGSSSALPIFF